MLRAFLQSVDLFSELDDAGLDRLAEISQSFDVAANQLLFRESDPVDAFYIVYSGEVAVFRDAPGKPNQLLARLGSGGYFGEMGLLNRAHRLASARTSTASSLVRIDKADLMPFLADHPAVELKLRGEVVRRHGRNVSALLGLAGQRDVRIRLGIEAIATFPDGLRHTLLLDNLSLGGIALSGALEEWQLGKRVEFTLGVSGELEVLPVRGRVAWREGERAGIAFDPNLVADGTPAARALRSFVERVRGAARG